MTCRHWVLGVWFIAMLASCNRGDPDAARVNIVGGTVDYDASVDAAREGPGSVAFPGVLAVFGPAEEDGTRSACTGTLIGRQHVLTAGHCLRGYRVDRPAASWTFARA